MFKALFTLVLTFSMLFVRAQSSIEVGFNGGGALYNGDLSPAFNKDYPKFVEPAFGLFVRKDFSKMFSGRIHLHQARLRGSDVEAGRNFRNLNFRNNITELSLLGEINLLNVPVGYRYFQFYLFGGGAVFHHNPKTFYQGTFVELQPLGTEGQGIAGNPDNYSKVQLALPFGGGLKIPIGSTVKLTLEAGARKMFFDYIDDVGDLAVNYDELLAGNGPLAVALFDRTHELSGEAPSPFTTGTRGGEFDDWYYIFTLGISFDLNVTPRGGGRNAKCPTF